MIKLKEGVNIEDLCPEMERARDAIDAILEPMGYDTVITSGNDGQHKPGSFHYSGRALDFRTKHIEKSQRPLVVLSVKLVLRKGYDVLWENKGQDNEHLHVEWDPKG